jgi:DNA-binding response OmpR family regulator
MSKLVMIIDDSPTVRNIVGLCLSREGYDVVGCPDGVTAMRWLAKPDARIPELIILDVGLPRLDGFEVACRLKAKPQFAQTVIIMLSRHDGMLDKLKGRLAGAREYLVKPFKTEILAAVVEKYIGKQDEQANSH